MKGFNHNLAVLLLKFRIGFINLNINLFKNSFLIKIFSDQYLVNSILSFLMIGLFFFAAINQFAIIVSFVLLSNMNNPDLRKFSSQLSNGIMQKREASTHTPPYFSRRCSLIMSL